MRRALAAASFAALAASALSAEGKELAVSPVVGGDFAASFAAVPRMVFEYYRVPNVDPKGDFSCAIAQASDDRCAADCQACDISSLGAVQAALQKYPARAVSTAGRPLPSIEARLRSSPLPVEALEAEIDGGRPIVAQLEHGLASYAQAHLALIIGYEKSESGVTLIVNDPVEYSGASANAPPNPYLALGAAPSSERGRYAIEYELFTDGLRWTASLEGVVSGEQNKPSPAVHAAPVEGEIASEPEVEMAPEPKRHAVAAPSAPLPCNPACSSRQICLDTSIGYRCVERYGNSSPMPALESRAKGPGRGYLGYLISGGAVAGTGVSFLVVGALIPSSQDTGFGSSTNADTARTAYFVLGGLHLVVAIPLFVIGVAKRNEYLEWKQGHANVDVQPFAIPGGGGGLALSGTL